MKRLISSRCLQICVPQDQTLDNTRTRPPWTNTNSPVTRLHTHRLAEVVLGQGLTKPEHHNWLLQGTSRSPQHNTSITSLHLSLSSIPEQTVAAEISRTQPPTTPGDWQPSSTRRICRWFRTIAVGAQMTSSSDPTWPSHQSITSFSSRCPRLQMLHNSRSHRQVIDLHPARRIPGSLSGLKSGPSRSPRVLSGTD